MTVTRDDLYANITDCRARVLRGVVDNVSLMDIVQEAQEVTKAVLGLQNGAMFYKPLTETDAIRMDNARLADKTIDTIAAGGWLTVAAKINTLYKQNGYLLRVEEFFLQY